MIEEIPPVSEKLCLKLDFILIFRDNDAREYWLQCFEEGLPKFADRAIQSQVNFKKQIYVVKLLISLMILGD